MLISDQEILIFGGTGSLGKALIRRLRAQNRLHIYSRDEAKHWTIKNQLQDLKNISFYVGDIRDPGRVKDVCHQVNPNIVIIASALKQVDTCEQAPFEAIQTNIMGCDNLIKCVLSGSKYLTNLSSVLLVSTDKACAPTNVYGMTKSIAERLITSQKPKYSNIKFIAVRYGNVLESRGSIIPLFKYQVESSLPLSVTHPDMTRFIMTLDQSIDLIERTINESENGDIWIPKLKSMRIIDLAEIFATRFKSEIKLVGMRPGEKIHEDLISKSESIRTFIDGEDFVIKPPLSEATEGITPFSYSSDQSIVSKFELDSFLESLGIFNLDLKEFHGREIEEIGRGI